MPRIELDRPAGPPASGRQIEGLLRAAAVLPLQETIEAAAGLAPELPAPAHRPLGLRQAGIGTSSTSFITLTGLKKWVTAMSCRRRSGWPSVIARSGMPEVFLLTTEPARRSGSICANRARLVARSSITASQIQS